MELTPREERALRLLRDVQRLDMDIHFILKGEKSLGELGFSPKLIEKNDGRDAMDILENKRDFVIQELRKLLNPEDEEYKLEDKSLYLEKTRTKGLTKSI